MPDGAQRRFRSGSGRLLWFGFRLVLLLMLCVGGALLYLRTIGPPDFLVAHLQSSLRQRGFDLQTGRIRLRGLTLVIENIHLQRSLDQGPEARIARAEVRFAGKPLRTGRLEPSAIQLTGGEVAWRFATSNAEPRWVFLDHLSADLRLNQDQLRIAQLDGRLLDAHVSVTGAVTNLSAMRRWAASPQGKPQPDWDKRASNWFRHAQSLKLTAPSEISLDIRADAQHPNRANVALQLTIPAAASAAGSVEALEIRASAQPVAQESVDSAVQVRVQAKRGIAAGIRFDGANLSGELIGCPTNGAFKRFAWELHLDELKAQSVTARELAISGVTQPDVNVEGGLQTHLRSTSNEVLTPWAGATSNSFTADLHHGWSRLAAWDVHWRVESGKVRSSRGELTGLDVSGDLAPRCIYAQWQLPDASWGPWLQLEPFELDWAAAVQQLKSPDLEINNASCSGRWRAPELDLERLGAELYGGAFEGAASMDVSHRGVQVQGSMDFDGRRIAPLLTPASRKWLSQFGWETPPTVTARLALRLPPWSDAKPRWREDVMPTIEITGELAGSNGTFRGVPVGYTHSHFALTNLTWYLPDLYVRRPDGEARLAYVGHMGTHEFHWDLDGRLDPRALKPMLQEEGIRRAVDQFQFTGPPSVQGQVWGRWQAPESVQFVGRIKATNFTFRGEQCDELRGAVRLTNSVLGFSNVELSRRTERISVPAGSFDLTERVVYLTNAIATMDPDLVTRVIGPKIRAAMQPYRFEKPPTVRVNGRLPTVDIQDADVRFEVAGGPFSYWKLRVPSIMGDVLWRAERVSITNVQGSFYGGDLVWQGEFDFSVPVGAALAFKGTVRNADLHALAGDFTHKRNNLQGRLNSEFTITRADSDDWRSWEGFGRAALRDGFLWDIPIFGFFSPVLNTVVPGLGNSPVSAADATFTIHEGVLFSDDLELKSPALRLNYSGSFDAKGHLDARMQAEVLRDAWGVGRALSLALWPLSKAFEYKLTGTVQQPKSEPVYIPKFFLWPLHPIRSLKQLFSPRRPDRDPISKPSLFDNVP